MPHPDVVQAIESHVRAAFTHCPVFGEDEAAGTPDDGGPFLVLSFPYARSEQETVGDDADFVEEGAFNLTLALPRGGGARQGRTWLEATAATMRARYIGRVWCAAPQPAVLDDDMRDASHMRLIMAVPYRFSVAG